MVEVMTVSNISKSFGKKKVLDNVNFSIKPGEIIGLIGYSGAGKSVLIKIILGLLKSDTGNIETYSTSKDPIGISFQENAIYDNLTVKQNFKYFSRIYGLKKDFSEKQIDSLINLLSLNDFENVLVRKLSGGTKKRVDIGCALLKDPEIIIFDEPLSGLDSKLINNLLQLFLYLNKSGKTIIITSHQLYELYRICNRFLLLKDKQIFEVEKSKLSEVYP